MKTFTGITFALATSLLFSTNASAYSITYTDEWVNWPGYSSEHSNTDSLGYPSVNTLKVTISDDNKFLQKVEIFLGNKNYLNFHSLFINTDFTNSANQYAWDYFVHAGGTGQSSVSYNGAIPGNGLWDVKDTYTYTSANDNDKWEVREGNPNGIDEGSLTLLDASFKPSLDDKTLTYNFNNNGLALNGGFFIAWAPWCANDVIGGGKMMNPVPEPTTMLLFGTGLIGLAGIARRRQNA